MKIPNDLIKSTNLEKQKHRIPKEFEYVNGKFIQHYVLGGECELTNEQIIDCLNALAMIDSDLQMAYAVLQDKSHENKVLKRALELACNGWYDVDCLCYVCKKVCERQFDDNIECMVEHLIQQAEKEVTEDETNE